MCLNSSSNHTHVEIQAKNKGEKFIIINRSSCKNRTSSFAKPMQCFDPSCTDVADKSKRNLFVFRVVMMLLNVKILTL